MFQMIGKMVKWASIPVLLMAAVFSCMAWSYEPLLDCVLCLGALFFVQRAVAAGEYFWAAGFLGIVVIFSPLFLALKIFLLMGLGCIGAFLTLYMVFRAHPVAVAE